MFWRKGIQSNHRLLFLFWQHLNITHTHTTTCECYKLFINSPKKVSLYRYRFIYTYIYIYIYVSNLWFVIIYICRYIWSTTIYCTKTEEGICKGFWDRKRSQLGWIGQDKKSPTERANVEFMAKEWRLLTSDEETFILFSGLLR